MDIFDILVFYTLCLFFLNKFYKACLKRRLHDDRSIVSLNCRYFPSCVREGVLNNF